MMFGNNQVEYGHLRRKGGWAVRLVRRPGVRHPGVGGCLALFARMNWTGMDFRSRWTLPDPFLASHRDGDEAGGNAMETTPDILTVSPEGRSTEAIVKALSAMPGELARLVDGKSDEQLARPSQDGGSGMVEILPHLRDWEVILADRVDLMLTEDAPTLEDYDDSLWAIEHGYGDQDPRQALDEFSERRAALVERLEALDAAAWNRTGIMPKPGRVTLHWLLNLFCDHDAKHLVQARDVLA
jgi:hypothetical protein